MKNEAKNYRNMVDDPFLYRNCCGGVTVGADGSVEVVKEKTIGNKLMGLVAGVVVIVGIVVTSTYVYNRWIK